jgi:membrane protease YdiL (CAAX protease family)
MPALTITRGRGDGLSEPQLRDTDHRRQRLRRFARAAIALAAVVLAAGVGWGSLRIAILQRSELADETAPSSLRRRASAPGATPISVRLGAARLNADEQAVFELCAEADLCAPRFEGAFDVAVLDLAKKQLMLRVPLDHAHLARVKRGQGYSCLVLGSGTIEHAGEYSVEAVWSQPLAAGTTLPPSAAGVADVPLVLRILAKPPLTLHDAWLVGALGAAALVLTVALMLLSPPPAPAPPAPAPPAPPRVAAALPLAAIALVYAVMQYPSAGGLWTLWKGVLLAAVQIGCALLLTRQRAHARLGLQRPRLLPGLTGAVVAWPSLVAGARLALRWVPSTGEAPLQTFIAQPSGMLSAALLGVLLPIGEELFFRGYVFGAWTRFGTWAAAIGSVLAFGLMHTQQSWGNWGGLAAVFVTGAVLCALRVLTRSTWLAMLTHLAYNLTLSLTSIAAAIDTR